MPDAREDGENGPLTTPDGRYIVVRGRLWRATNPNLAPVEREALVHELMDARRAKRDMRGKADDAAWGAACDRVDAVKRRLGERGPAWWTDGAPDYNRKLAKNTPYAEWFAETSVPD